MTISYDDFLSVDIRSGTILTAEMFEGARRPAYKLTIDFGAEIGIKKSSAQITDLYDADALVGSQIQAVVNFPPKQIGKFMSEVLVLGFADDSGRIVLMRPTHTVPNGRKLL